MINPRKYYSYLVGVILLFIIIVLIIMWGHTGIGFWYQSDSLFVPHFVQDVIVNHHQIMDWYFGAGMTQLFTMLPDAFFSLFTNNFEIWRIADVCFLLTSYFLLFLVLGKILFNNKAASLLLPISSLISLALLASFKQIPFTLDMLLVSGQHGELILVTLLCLNLLLVKLKNANNHWALPLLFLSIFLEATSDEILILAFVMPALVVLFLFFIKSKKLINQKQKGYYCILNAILTIITATLASRLAWTYLPLMYPRQGPTLIFGKNSIKWASLSLSSQGHSSVSLSMNFMDLLHTVGHYLNFMFLTYPIYMVCVFLAFPFCLIVGVYGLRASGWDEDNATILEKRLQLFALLFVSIEWLSGMGRFFITRHVIEFFASYSLKDFQFLHFAIHGFACDSVDFFILPLFLGVPIVIGYLVSFLKDSKQKWLLNTAHILSIAVIMILLVHAGNKILHTVSYATQKKNAEQLMQCLQTNIKINHLHTGVADYWIYRPIVFLSDHQVSLSAVSSAPGAFYEHYVSSWDEIANKNIDFWVTRYDRFFNDPTYTNYYNTHLDVADKLKHFGPPDGQFICHADDGTWLQVYFYRHNQIMKSLLPSIHWQGKPRATINDKNQMSLE